MLRSKNKKFEIEKRCTLPIISGGESGKEIMLFSR
jgi:hypothetical protein